MGKRSLLDVLNLRSRAPSLEEFRDRVAHKVLRLRPGTQIVRADGADLEIKWPDLPQPAEFTVADHYAKCLERPRHADDLVRHAASLINIGGDAPRPEWLTLLVVREDIHPDGRAESPYLTRPIASGINAQIVIDAPSGYQFLSGMTLRETLGLDDRALWTRATANTRERLNPGDGLQRDIPAGKATQIQRADGLMASLVLFDEFWDAPARTAVGPEVVALISPNFIVVAPLSDATALGRMREHVASVPKGNDWITSDLIVRRGGGWEVLS